jgi:hypothetical protein
LPQKDKKADGTKGEAHTRIFTRRHQNPENERAKRTSGRMRILKLLLISSEEDKRKKEQ